MVLDNIYLDMDKTPTLLGFLIDFSVWPLNQLKMACGRAFLFVII